MLVEVSRATFIFKLFLLFGWAKFTGWIENKFEDQQLPSLILHYSPAELSSLIWSSDSSAPGAAGREYQQVVGVHRQTQPGGCRDRQQSQETRGWRHHPPHDHRQDPLKLRTQEEEELPQVSSPGWHWQCRGQLNFKVLSASLSGWEKYSISGGSCWDVSQFCWHGIFWVKKVSQQIWILSTLF